MRDFTETETTKDRGILYGVMGQARQALRRRARRAAAGGRSGGTRCRTMGDLHVSRDTVDKEPVIVRFSPLDGAQIPWAGTRLFSAMGGEEHFVQGNLFKVGFQTALAQALNCERQRVSWFEGYGEGVLQRVDIRLHDGFPYVDVEDSPSCAALAHELAIMATSGALFQFFPSLVAVRGVVNIAVISVAPATIWQKVALNGTRALLCEWAREHGPNPSWEYISQRRLDLYALARTIEMADNDDAADDRSAPPQRRVRQRRDGSIIACAKTVWTALSATATEHDGLIHNATSVTEQDDDRYEEFLDNVEEKHLLCAHLDRMNMLDAVDSIASNDSKLTHLNWGPNTIEPSDTADQVDNDLVFRLAKALEGNTHLAIIQLAAIDHLPGYYQARPGQVVEDGGGSVYPLTELGWAALAAAIPSSCVEQVITSAPRGDHDDWRECTVDGWTAAAQIRDACMENRVSNIARAYRPVQRLLLGVLLYRGKDCTHRDANATPMTDLVLPVNQDVMDRIVEHLNTTQTRPTSMLPTLLKVSPYPEITIRYQHDYAVDAMVVAARSARVAAVMDNFAWCLEQG